jgi:hypothetical protein
MNFEGFGLKKTSLNSGWLSNLAKQVITHATLLQS